MATKKEKLKFYRIYTRTTSSVPDADNPLLIGYINNYSEFKQYDDNDVYAVSGYTNPSPKDFFKSDVGAYEQLSFLIDGITVPYNRTTYNLNHYRSRIYTVSYDSMGPIGTSFISPTAASKRIAVTPKNSTETILTFYVNPTHLSITKRKLFQQIRTRAGWEFQHWGPQIGEIRIEGVTGNITPPTRIVTGKVLGLPILPQIVEDAPTDTNSPALKAFRQLERWYDEDQDERAQFEGRLLALEYRGHMYVGHIGDFTHEERSEHPFMLFYNLTFLIHYESTSFANATDRAQKKVIRNLETLKYINSLRESPSTTNVTTNPDSTSSLRLSDTTAD